MGSNFTSDALLQSQCTWYPVWSTGSSIQKLADTWPHNPMPPCMQLPSPAQVIPEGSCQSRFIPGHCWLLSHSEGLWESGLAIVGSSPNLLSSDSLQFGFKAGTSTTHCTWLVSEVVQHLLRNGTNPIVTVLDCTKAFDLCKFSLLFQRLLDSGLPSIVVRCLMMMYQEQYGWVRWGQARSNSNN